MQNDQCPVCGLQLKDRGTDKDRGNIRQYRCDKCGKFELHRSSESKIKSESKKSPKFSAALSHVICKMQKKNEWPLLPLELVEKIINEPTLPSLSEQSDNLIKWLGDNIDAPGAKIHLKPNKLCAIIGAISDDNLNFVVKSLFSQKMVISRKSYAQKLLTLTLKGW